MLLAVSGGVDSTVLCQLCHEAGFSFSIAHCNFGLRGEESIRDEVFVSTLAEKYKVPLYLNRFNTKDFAEAHKLSIQEAARKLRYDWFEDILKKNDLNYLLTAHHLDDNIETILMNFFKGTGISGLRGILPKSGNIIRPLLFEKREEIESYAIEKNLSWVNDSSNDESKYTRNYFRHQIIPSIEKVFPEAITNMAQNIPRFMETEILYRQAVAIHKRNLLQLKGAEVHIPVLKLLKSNPLSTIVFEIIKEYGFSGRQVNEVIRLLNSETGKYIQSVSHRILRNRKWLIISPLKTENAQMIIIEKDQTEVFYDDQKMLIHFQEERPISFSNDNKEAVLDFKDIQFPLIIRKWKPGDYFYPLGMPKKKKLSRFFIDLKLSKGGKEHVWVLESNKRIIWVIGLRIDDRFKVTSSTKKTLRLQLRDVSQ
ncbi:tRNA lysidine(34) synthetase TilS [Chitinophagaceae bacterium LB-8]|uniref:tRNA(Ile)-lysidine synthase n=1 Tax=Paraflavisolibacter caeni TaxID=2982496 RepID=A0A9X3BJ19_9BACT|nr:tRNA lysidine(34) synthetase TilS [Paraflavisolibacter caeni]MCU7552187.1 tRNA lysidine(34) synthetase TilS [Paraflavisolibacter caeni]